MGVLVYKWTVHHFSTNNPSVYIPYSWKFSRVKIFTDFADRSQSAKMLIPGSQAARLRLGPLESVVCLESTHPLASIVKCWAEE